VVEHPLFPASATNKVWVDVEVQATDKSYERCSVLVHGASMWVWPGMWMPIPSLLLQALTPETIPCKHGNWRPACPSPNPSTTLPAFRIEGQAERLWAEHYEYSGVVRARCNGHDVGKLSGSAQAGCQLDKVNNPIFHRDEAWIDWMRKYGKGPKVEEQEAQ